MLNRAPLVVARLARTRVRAAVLHAIHDVLLDALRAAPPRGGAAQRWLGAWLDLQGRDPWGLWTDQAVVEAAGPDVASRYSQRVARDWADWLRMGCASPVASPKPAAGWRSGDTYDPARYRLRSRYLDDLRRQDDAAGVLEVLRSDLIGAHEFLELARQLEGMGREREALQALETAGKKLPGDWRLEEALLLA